MAGGDGWASVDSGRVALIDSTWCIFRTPSLLLLLLRPTNPTKYQIPWVVLIDSRVRMSVWNSCFS